MLSVQSAYSYTTVLTYKHIKSTVQLKKYQMPETSDNMITAMHAPLER